MKVGVVHVPKTFGMSLRRALERQNHGHEVVFCKNSLHESYKVNESRLAECDVVVSVVRNPYDRHVSQCEEELARFSKNKHGHELAYARVKALGFVEPLKHDRESWGAFGPERDFFPFSPQYTYITNTVGEVYANVKLFKFEDGVKPLEDFIGVKIPHFNKSKSPNLPWKFFIDNIDALRLAINDHYQRDFSLFDYEIL